MDLHDPSDRFDQSTENGQRFTLTVNFDMALDLDELVFAQMYSTVMVTVLREHQYVRNVTAELIDHHEPVEPEFLRCLADT